MESATRFNLKTAREEWRGEMRHQPGLSEDIVKELEQHLTQAMEDLRARGLGEEEAFLVARHRVGSPTRLGEEFRKADPTAVWRGRMLWMVAGWGTMVLWKALLEPFWPLVVRTWNEPGSWLGGSIVLAYSLVGLAPLGIAALMSRGRLTHLTDGLTPLFRSRFRAVVSVTLGVSFILWVGGVITQVSLRSMGGVPSAGFLSADLLLMSALAAVVRGLLGGVLVFWLMPARVAQEAQESSEPV